MVRRDNQQALHGFQTKVTYTPLCVHTPALLRAALALLVAGVTLPLLMLTLTVWRGRRRYPYGTGGNKPTAFSGYHWFLAKQCASMRLCGCAAGSLRSSDVELTSCV
jgi:hypothetical protein